MDRLTREPVDLLVIGGGITGAGIARDAAMRGLTTALVEQHDFAAGTSSRSSRLIHGGLRYLEEGALHLVFEASRERRTLLRLAPHLVRPLPFVFPVHKGDRVPLWKVAIGVWLYQALALFRNVRRPRILGKRTLLRLEPALKARGLTGGARYYDAQCDDARLTLAVIRSALSHGALVANYMAVTALTREAGRISGASVADRLTGDTGVIRAKAVVNATGPWADRLRKMEDHGAAPLLGVTKGAHVLVRRSRLGHQEAITMTSPLDGRVMFALPWGPFSYIGTTDTTTTESADDVAPRPEDITYLLRSANAYFPNAHLSGDDVLAAWAALRPLLVTEPGRGPSQRSREHRIVRGAGGMYTIAGGKLTTFRSMAAELVDQVAATLRKERGFPRLPPPGTDHEPLPGGEVPDHTAFRQAGLDLGLSMSTVVHLWRHYGTEMAAIFNLVREQRLLMNLLDPAHPAIEAEILHIARRELPARVEDVMVRRLHFYYEIADQGRAAAPRVTELMARELGWDADRRAAELSRYLDWLETLPEPGNSKRGESDPALPA
ncbi:MAG TPA: glycerol-3-phosphate dehydrogenase/oxidase [Gemmatimonadales bacterium]|nr:glycerol-3-phosphate dehydrogenase/oxidase [Gemmatimonadales bacterium]